MNTERRISLKDIINSIKLLDELHTWALENELSSHPWIQQRKDDIIRETVGTFSEVASLTYWAIENNVLCHNAVIDRLNVFLTCKWCNFIFNAESELRQHEVDHHMLNEIVKDESQKNQPSDNVGTTNYTCNNLPGSQLENISVKDFFSIVNDSYSNENVGHMSSYSVNSMLEWTDSDTIINENLWSILGTNSDANISAIQFGKGEVQEDDDTSAYIFRKTGEKTFAKNLAVETTYKIKFTDVWKGRKLKTLLKQIQGMFQDVLAKARGNDGDLGRVIINHPDLNNAVVVPLQKWSNLNADTVMENIERVLNSDENLALDDQMQVTVGNINIPQGSGALDIIRLTGPQNSIALKRSLLKVVNNDHLCLATAIGRCFLKLCKIVPLDEWKRITQNDNRSMNSMMKVIKHRATTKSFYKHVGDSTVKRYGKNMAVTLCKEAGVPTDRPLGLSDIKPFEDLLDVNILVLSSKLGNRFCRVSNNHSRQNLYLYMTSTEDTVGHFDGIGNINGFFGYGYFCEFCLKPYKNKGKHSCETTCNVCCRDPCLLEIERSCRHCKRTCRSRECYEAHISRRNNKGKEVEKSLCEKIYQCKDCRKVFEREKRKPEDHVCGEYQCKNCLVYFCDQHLCYQRRSFSQKTVDKKSPRKFFFYDFETTQNERMSCMEGYAPGSTCDGCTQEMRCNKCRICTNCKEPHCGLEEHKVNFAVLQSTCEKCMGDELEVNSRCVVCGSRCVKCRIFKKNTFVSPCLDRCGYRQRVFKGFRAVVDFCDHIMTPHYKNTVLIAHNAKSFDNYPILNTLIDYHGVKPYKILYNGSKIMLMKVGKGIGLTFLDSMNFISMRLSKIPACFDLKELRKGYFPHLFNTKENQTYIGPYPDPEFYGCDFMESGEREKFLQWYTTKRNEVFNFQEQMYEYCVSDVDILRRGCMKFRQLLMEVTSKNGSPGIDPFDYVTIASVCQGIYRHLFLEETYETEVLDLETETLTCCRTMFHDGEWKVLLPNNEWTRPTMVNVGRYKVGKRIFVKSPIGIVPSEGYTSRNNFSKVSIQWLEWTMWITNQERKNGKVLRIQHALNGGEHRVPGTKYRLDGFDEETKTAYEFLGCIFHGCHTCFPHDRRTTTHPVTKHSMNELYFMTKKKEMVLLTLGYQYKSIWEHEFYQQLKVNAHMREYVSSLDIVDRLNPRDSFFGGRTNAIKLFHEVNELGETIEYYDYTSLYPSVNKYGKYPIGHPTIITSNFKHISEYMGIAKLSIRPPRRLYHPVLPYLSNGKLKFPLCRTCADTENENDCRCSDKDRMLTGTWCTPEIQLACSKGYEIVKIYEVYHFEESSCYDKVTGTGGLFTDYVNMFLKLKQEASGFPPECTTTADRMTYVANYALNEGINLDFEAIKQNPGLRNLAKICLNSFWGKFGQRLNMKQSSFLYEHEVDKFFQLLTDCRKDIRDFHIVSNEIIQLEYFEDSAFLPFDYKTNVFIASFTTAWARIKLYELLEITQRNALYVDTDSIIFNDVNKQITQRLPVGNYLGELTSEISPEEGHITTFVSSGPKAYAYRTTSGKEICKVRGFTLNWVNSNLLNFTSIKELILNKHTTGSITTKNPRKICRIPLKRKLCNRIEEKEYKMVYTKRRLLDDLTTLPFGY